MTASAALTGPLVEAVGWALVHSLWQGALVAALLASANVFLRRRSAEARYAAASAALGVLLLLPAGTFLRLRGETLRPGWAEGAALAALPAADASTAGASMLSSEAGELASPSAASPVSRSAHPACRAPSSRCTLFPAGPGARASRETGCAVPPATPRSAPGRYPHAGWPSAASRSVRSCLRIKPLGTSGVGGYTPRCSNRRPAVASDTASATGSRCASSCSSARDRSRWRTSRNG